MKRKMIDPKEQFSKWLAKSGAIYWIVYNSLLLILICIRPETATSCVYLSIIISVVMVLHVIFYTRNSLGEKIILAALDKTRMELTIGGKTQSEPEPDEPEEEGGGNG